MQRYTLICCYIKKRGMKHPSEKLSFLAVLLYLTACTKADVSSKQYKPGDISGKWNLVNDSTFEGVGVSNHLANYNGETGDYFNFSSNGYVYTRENSKLDTLTYKMVSDTSIIISSFGLILNGSPDTSIITNLKANNGLGLTVRTIVIESPFFLTPGGEFWRKVTLSR
jgi:hypothetical protein